MVLKQTTCPKCGGLAIDGLLDVPTCMDWQCWPELPSDVAAIQRGEAIDYVEVIALGADVRKVIMAHRDRLCRALTIGSFQRGRNIDSMTLVRVITGELMRQLWGLAQGSVEPGTDKFRLGFVVQNILLTNLELILQTDEISVMPPGTKPN